MHVIRHHTPRMQSVPLAIEMQQSDFDDLSQAVISKKARSVAAIKKVLNPLSPFEVCLFFRTCSEFLTPTVKHSLWQRIKEVKRDVLCHALAIKVWEVAA